MQTTRTEGSSLAEAAYSSPFSSRGRFANVEQQTTESTTLLASQSCDLSRPPMQTYGSPNFSERQSRGKEHCSENGKALESPERSTWYRNQENKSERDYSRPSRRRSSSDSNQRPERSLRAHSTSSSTMLNEAEICQNPSDNLATSSPQRSPLFSLPQGVSLRLENSGSVARDHLASERTFLAYMRTSLAIASSGVALVQLFSAASSSQGAVHRLHVYIRPLGASTVVVGLLVLVIGVTRYFTVQAALTKGYFPVARMATGLIAVVLTALVALTFAIMMAGKLEAKGPKNHNDIFLR